MVNGEFGFRDGSAPVNHPQDVARNLDGYSISILGEESPGRFDTSSKFVVGIVSVQIDANGTVYASNSGEPRYLDRAPLVSYNSDTLVRLILTNNNILDVVYAYQVMDGTIYYSGTKGGQPQTGFFVVKTKVNVVLEKKHVYSSISHLL